MVSLLILLFILYCIGGAVLFTVCESANPYASPRKQIILAILTGPLSWLLFIILGPIVYLFVKVKDWYEE